MAIKVIWASVVLFCALTVNGMSEDMENVEQVTNFDELDGWWMVAVYLEGCSYCKMLEPEWKALGIKAGNRFKDLHIGKAKSSEVKLPAEIPQKYPAVVMFTNEGEIVEYKEHNNRVLNGFLRFIADNTPYEIDGGTAAMSASVRQALTRIYYYWDVMAARASQPTRLEAMIDLIKDGSILRSTLVAIAGDADWKVASEFPDLHDHFKPDSEESLAAVPGVRDLTQENYSKLTSDGRYWLVVFYSPGCGFCKILKPELEALGHQITSQHSRYAVGRVNCDEETSLAAEHKITGYPTIIGVKPSGKREDFTDHANRYKAQFVEFLEGLTVEKDAESAATQADSGLYDLADDTFDRLTTDGRIWLVVFYAPGCGFCKRVAPEIKALAAEITADHSRYAIGQVNGEKEDILVDRFKISGYPTIAAFTDEKRVDFTDHANRVKSRFLTFLDEIASGPSSSDKDEEL